jgi:flavin-dependent dehydrogenase
MTYDLVIMGGGLAGSSLATCMAQNGARVLVLERTNRDSNPETKTPPLGRGQ